VVGIVMVPLMPKVEYRNRMLRMEATLSVVCELARCGALKSDHRPGFRRAYRHTSPTSQIRL
jgi:hypothetical protein